MGLNVYGAIEINLGYRGDMWRKAADLDYLLSYTGTTPALECLFGLGDKHGFKPVAAFRGLPENVDKQSVAAMGLPNVGGATWVAWTELQKLDWDETAEPPSGLPQVSHYRHTESRGRVFLSSDDLTPDRYDDLGVPDSLRGALIPQGTEWTNGADTWRVQPLSRREAVGFDDVMRWKPPLTVMDLLGQIHGHDNVRLVAWFED